MTFASYPSYEDVARAYQITCTQDNFITPLAMSVSDYLRSELLFARRTSMSPNRKVPPART